ncbi:MAG TPA: hypothetical protein VMM55_01995, partial [Thermohalobaculum sp.]|nr:hypothetical protein [Thermohalobaculum sp.]
SAPVEALAFVERVAAGCLLDGVVGGAAMIVDRPGSRVLIVGEDEELLALAVRPGSRGSQVELSGPAADDRAMRRRVQAALDRAARTGDPTCPPRPAGEGPDCPPGEVGTSRRGSAATPGAGIAMFPREPAPWIWSRPLFRRPRDRSRSLLRTARRQEPAQHRT